MKILRTLVLKDLKFNKKRTVGTIVGVVLSCALIVVIFGMFVSLYNSLLENEIRYGGYYHLKINNVNEDRIKELKDNERIKDVISIRNAGYLESEIANDYFVSEDLYSMDKDTFDLMKYKIEKGRFPENSEEVLISNSIKYMLNIDIGDYIDVKINENEVKAKVVGLSNRYGEIITTGVQNGDYNAYIVLKNPSSFKKDIINIIGDGTIKFNEIYHGDFEINLNILRWEVFDLSDEVSSFFVRILTIIVIIIVVTSVFSIRNSFAISTSEKLKSYGMLSSVGATKKQIKKMVLFEGFVIGCIGTVIGIVLGIVVNILLIFIINYLCQSAGIFNSGFGLIYKFSFIPIIISIIISFVVVYFSVIMSAIKASRVNPIQNIRNSQDIKAKKLKSPWYVRKIFGIGGILSYKNLKRSKKKYRVTVISLTVSIMIFIITYSLVNYGVRTIREQFGSLDYNVIVYGEGLYRNEDPTVFEKVKKMPGAIVSYEYGTTGPYDIEDKSKLLNIDQSYIVGVQLMLYDDNYFKKYVKSIGENYDDVKDKFIVINRNNANQEDKKEYSKKTNYKKGDTIVTSNYSDRSDKILFQVGAVTDYYPIDITSVYVYGDVILVGNQKYFQENDKFELYDVNIYFDSDNPYELENEIKEISDDIYVENIKDEVQKLRTIVLIVSIIVYGFIAVISLIGVTSVFNTINSNMELRSRDFATLKSIGMTKKEFNNMINLEAVFYSSKSLLIGSILGVIFSYLAYKVTFLESYNFEYVFPIEPIIISIIFIVVLILLIMKYSIKKINKQNIIETIRNSNI